MEPTFTDEAGAGGLTQFRGVFGVDQQRQLQLGEDGDGRAQVCFVKQTETFAAGVDQEGFEAGDTGGGKFRQLCLIAVFGPSPGPPVDHGPALRRGSFGFEAGQGGSRGKAVERHVDESGDASGGGGAGSCLESLPLGASGLVEVDVRVDQAGKQAVVAEVVDDIDRTGRIGLAIRTMRPETVSTMTATGRTASRKTTRREM